MISAVKIRKSSAQPTGELIARRLSVVIILGAVGLGLSLSAAGGRGESRILAHPHITDEVTMKLEEYRMLGGMYPSQAQGLMALVMKPTTAPIPRRWAQIYDEAPLDSWDNELKYLFPGSQNPKKPEVISAGPDEKFGTDDDVSSQD